MERLSDTAIEIINELHTERLDYSSEYIPLIDAANSLAAYEDSGLEPEEIADFMKRWEQAVEIGGMLKKYGIDHIWDIIQAEQDGRLVVLPCKVVCGTVIWWADSNFYADPIKCEVSSFGIYTGTDGDLRVWMNCYVYGPTPMSKSFRMSSIGKTVFLTREEAEAALEKEGGTDEDSGSL